jgi:hypothetical protein
MALPLGERLAKSCHLLNDSLEHHAQRGQAVLGTWWHLGIDGLDEQSMTLKHAQSLSKDLGADAWQTCLQFRVALSEPDSCVLPHTPACLS